MEDLRYKQENMQAATVAARAQIRKNESYIRMFKNAVYWVAQNIDDYEKLKMSVITELKQFVEKQGHTKNVVEDSDIQNEYKKQMIFLNNASKTLKQKHEREQAAHRRDNNAVMERN